MLILVTTVKVCDARDDASSNTVGNIIIPNFNQQIIIMKPTVTIEYCPKCGWLLRAAYMAQELLTTFNEELKAVTLQPSEVSGDFHITIDGKKIWRLS
jgi:selT/selW/selH-like putative selenoprotein